MQRTIRIGFDQHAGGFTLPDGGVMSDELAATTELQGFGRSRLRYRAHRRLGITGSHLTARSCNTPARFANDLRRRFGH